MFTTLDKQHLPWELLLDADPDKEKIQMYVDMGSGFVWQVADEIKGVIVYDTRKTEYEIMNVAVAPSEQGRGIGRQLLLHAIKHLREGKNAQNKIIIRTGSVSSAALHLYKKVGFVEVSRDIDYFVKNYPEPIYENGELLRDQVTLELMI
ncbi:GNAT family N-acetyltransferase [Enterococcus durans]|uniref:GNAT family N-acetyltransferase n=1 Tax=Enterococcus durans TaxID=53345 RepID=UPI000F77D66E|nr:GNAT family N-acetyltransferase [Enterococcus durans]MBM1151525.1 GNAT family N-acetyltransferase [Enterococcus durans]MCA6741206.1 GNAT family N-acetyltransferase [Enterococcus durans]RSL37318.1 GNAT family N-acetyltransferase [Enterococcus durans]